LKSNIIIKKSVLWYFVFPLLISVTFVNTIWLQFGSDLDFSFYSNPERNIREFSLTDITDNRTQIVFYLAVMLSFIGIEEKLLFNLFGFLSAYILYRLLTEVRVYLPKFQMLMLASFLYMPSFMVYRTIYGKDSLAITLFLVVLLLATQLLKSGFLSVPKVVVLFSALVLGFLVRPYSGIILATCIGMLFACFYSTKVRYLIGRVSLEVSLLAGFVVLLLVATLVYIFVFLPNLSMYGAYYQPAGQSISRNHLLQGLEPLNFVAVGFYSSIFGPLPMEVVARPILILYTLQHLFLISLVTLGFFSVLKRRGALNYSVRWKQFIILSLFIPLLIATPIGLLPVLAAHLSFSDRYMSSFLPLLLLPYILFALGVRTVSPNGLVKRAHKLG